MGNKNNKNKKYYYQKHNNNHYSKNKKYYYYHQNGKKNINSNKQVLGVNDTNEEVMINDIIFPTSLDEDTILVKKKDNDVEINNEITSNTQNAKNDEIELKNYIDQVNNKIELNSVEDEIVETTTIDNEVEPNIVENEESIPNAPIINSEVMTNNTENQVAVENEEFIDNIKKPYKHFSLVAYVIGILLVLFVLTAVSYSFFSYYQEGNSQLGMTTGSVYVALKENTASLSMTKLYPMEQYTARSQNDNYVDFTIVGKNTGTVDGLFYSFYVANGDDVTGKNRIDSQYLLFDLASLDSQNNETRLLSAVSFREFNSAALSGFEIPPQTNSEIERKYRVRMWIKDDILISDTEQGAAYTQSEFHNLFASVKVGVDTDVKPTVVIVYNANGGTVSPASKYILQASTVYGDLPTPEYTGYAFTGWYTEESGGTLVDENTTYTHGTSPTSLYAHWVLGDTITYNANGGTVSPASKTIPQDATTYGTLPTPTPASGYVFNGWYTLAEGGTLVDANTTYTHGTSPTTLYAHWYSADTISFNANGGTVSPVAKTIAQSATEYGTLPTPEYAGYGFDGWYTLAEGGTLVEADTTYIHGTSTTTLYAHWTLNPNATLTLSANSGNVVAGSSITATITTNSNGALSCTSSDNTIATCSISGTTLTMNGVSAGSVTITVNQAAGTNYSQSTTTYSLTSRLVTTLSVSPTSGEIVCNASATATITTDGDGALSCTSSNDSLATCSISGNTLTINGVGEGYATITVTQAQGTNYISATATYTSKTGACPSWHYYGDYGSTSNCSNSIGCLSDCNDFRTAEWSCVASSSSAPSSASLSNGAHCWCYY